MEISLYNDKLATQDDYANELKRLIAMFPIVKPEFTAVLSNMMMKAGWTKQRVIDAVDNTIQTCIYPSPTAANILSWDKKAKLYTHTQVCNMMDSGYSWDDFDIIRREGEKPVWRLK